ncbi:hypothetical protein [Streptomyces purpureus]|uniref:C2H2-type domain-containing protein n=1 Tax=Streptomyces purpureus TaxID=1951 RepID=A0A918LQ70_9ACTN|nr:hypothetical protein [Streptomyces purpureus]GGT34585.1 hypothetical protein GCM10014713_30230 [Streptomyces purpureus]
MSEITGTSVGHESYAFACMRCGYGWEQSYDIEHHTDAAGHDMVVYRTKGQRVPSPLSNPTCLNCGSHVVRIMRAGQVSAVREYMERADESWSYPPVATAGPIGQKTSGRPTAPPEEPPPAEHHWHLSDLLHPFRERK